MAADRASPSRRPRLLGALLIVALSTIVLASPAAAETKHVRSLLEARRDAVVIQKFDLSCGAAALTTLLRYQHGDMLTERQVAISLMTREEYLKTPLIVRLRQGFSLLDLKRFVDARGYSGIGYGGLDLEGLIARAPIIVPIRTAGYNHFVVFRGAAGGRVLLADPAYGNRTMTLAKFERAWIDMPELGRVGFVVGRDDRPSPPGRLAARLSDFVTFH